MENTNIFKTNNVFFAMFLIDKGLTLLEVVQEKDGDHIFSFYDDKGRCNKYFKHYWEMEVIWNFSLLKRIYKLLKQYELLLEETYGSK